LVIYGAGTNFLNKLLKKIWKDLGDEKTTRKI
jgi:hypothetical protein